MSRPANLLRAAAIGDEIANPVEHYEGSAPSAPRASVRAPTKKTGPLAPDHTADIARRMEKAETDFCALLVQFGEITDDQARAVFAYYRKHKLIERDLWMAQWKVKHGGYFDRDVIRRAAGIEE